MRRRQFIASAPAVGLVPYLDRVPFLDRAQRPDSGQASGTATRHPATAAASTNVQIAVDRWSVVPTVKKAPKLDGTLKDPAWKKSRALTDFRTFYVNDSVPDDVEVRLLHDRKSLYIGVRYAAADVGATLANLEALVGPNPIGGPYFRVPIRVTDITPPYTNSWGPDIETPENIPVEVKPTPGVVTATAAIPFAAMGIDGHVPDGTQWRFNLIAQHMMMTKPASSWMPVRTSSNSYNGGASASVRAEVTGEGRLGAIYLGKPPSLDSDKPAEYWLPEDAALTYVGFTEKRLSFALGEVGQGVDVGLEWRTPTTDWEPIDSPAVESDRSRIQISFEHPGPLIPGAYELRVRLASGNGTKLGIVSFDRNGLIRAGDALYAS